MSLAKRNPMATELMRGQFKNKILKARKGGKAYSRKAKHAGRQDY